MSDNLKEGFEALLQEQGTNWICGATAFRAVAQSGAYAARNFADGNASVKILRLLRAELPSLPKEGEVLKRADAVCGFLVVRSRAVDDTFAEIEVQE